MKCKQCGVEYESKRNTSVYCGSKCKQEFYRNRMKPVVTLSNAKTVTVTDEPKRDTKLRFNVAEVSKPILLDVHPTKPKQGYIGAVPCTSPILEPNLKRGKAIKCFADLPPDIQQTIDTLSDDKVEHKRRTAIAIHYQHQFPDKYEPISLPSCCVMTESEREGYKPAFELEPGEYNHVSKPGDADYNGVCTEEWRAERGR